MNATKSADIKRIIAALELFKEQVELPEQQQSFDPRSRQEFYNDIKQSLGSYQGIQELLEYYNFQPGTTKPDAEASLIESLLEKIESEENFDDALSAPVDLQRLLKDYEEHQEAMKTQESKVSQRLSSGQRRQARQPAQITTDPSVPTQQVQYINPRFETSVPISAPVQQEVEHFIAQIQNDLPANTQRDPLHPGRLNSLRTRLIGTLSRPDLTVEDRRQAIQAILTEEVPELRLPEGNQTAQNVARQINSVATSTYQTSTRQPVSTPTNTYDTTSVTSSTIETPQSSTRPNSTDTEYPEDLPTSSERMTVPSREADLMARGIVQDIGGGLSTAQKGQLTKTLITELSNTIEALDPSSTNYRDQVVNTVVQAAQDTIPDITSRIANNQQVIDNTIERGVQSFRNTHQPAPPQPQTVVTREINQLAADLTATLGSDLGAQQQQQLKEKISFKISSTLDSLPASTQNSADVTTPLKAAIIEAGADILPDIATRVASSQDSLNVAINTRVRNNIAAQQANQTYFDEVTRQSNRIAQEVGGTIATRANLAPPERDKLTDALQLQVATVLQKGGDTDSVTKAIEVVLNNNNLGSNLRTVTATPSQATIASAVQTAREAFGPQAEPTQAVLREANNIAQTVQSALSLDKKLPRSQVIETTQAVQAEVARTLQAGGDQEAIIQTIGTVLRSSNLATPDVYDQLDNNQPNIAKAVETVTRIRNAPPTVTPGATAVASAQAIAQNVSETITTSSQISPTDATKILTTLQERLTPILQRGADAKAVNDTITAVLNENSLNTPLVQDNINQTAIRTAVQNATSNKLGTEVAELVGRQGNLTPTQRSELGKTLATGIAIALQTNGSERTVNKAIETILKDHKLGDPQLLGSLEQVQQTVSDAVRATPPAVTQRIAATQPTLSATSYETLEGYYRAGKISPTVFQALASEQQDSSHRFIATKVESVANTIREVATTQMDRLIALNPELRDRLHLKSRERITGLLIQDAIEVLGEAPPQDMQRALLEKLSQRLTTEVQPLLPSRKFDFATGAQLTAVPQQITAAVIANRDSQTVATLRSLQPLTQLAQAEVSNIDRNKPQRLYTKDRSQARDMDEQQIKHAQRLETTQKEIQTFLSTALPELDEKLRKQLSQDLVAATFGQVTLAQKIAFDKEGNPIFDENRKVKYATIRTPEGDLVNDYEIVIRDGILANFASQVLTVQDMYALGQLKSDDERIKWVQRNIKNERREEYIYHYLALQLQSKLKELEKDGEITPAVLARLNNLKYSDIYSPSDLTKMADQAKSEGKIFDPNKKVVIGQLLKEAVRGSTYFNDYMQQMLDRDKDAWRDSAPVSLKMHELAGYGNIFTKNYRAALGLLSPHLLESKTKVTAMNLVPNMLGTALKSMGMSEQTATSAWVFGALIGHKKINASIYRSDVANAVKLGIPIDGILRTGVLPDTLTGRKRLLAESIRLRYESQKNFEKFLKKHKRVDQFVNFMNTGRKNPYLTFGVGFVSSVAHGNVGGFFLGYTVQAPLNFAVNKILTAIPGFEPDIATKSIVFRPWIDVKERFKLRFKQGTTWVWKKVAGERIEKAWTNFTAKGIGKVIKGVFGFVGNLAIKAIPIFGQALAIYGAVNWLLEHIPILGEFYKLFKELFKLQLAILLYQTVLLAIEVVRFFNFLNPANWFSNAGASQSLAAKSIPAATNSISLNVTAPGTTSIGMVSAVPWSVQLWSSLTNWWATSGLSTISISQLLAIPSAFWTTIANMSTVSLAATAVLTVGPIIMFMYSSTIMTALKDGPDTLAGDALPYSNPMKINKTASPNQLSGTPSSGERETTFRINVTAPPCSNTMTVTDTVPENMTYLDPSTYAIPSAEQISANPESLIRSIDTRTETTPTGQLRIVWTININPAQVNPASCVSGNEDLENWQVFGDEQQSIERIKEILAPHRMGRDHVIGNTAVIETGDDVARAFYQSAQQYRINPLLVIGIYFFESQLGDTGIGRPWVLSGGVRQEGCFNAGGTRGSGCSSLENGEFQLYTNYAEPVNDTFRNLRQNYLDAGLTTVDQIINKYTPISDNNVENNPNSKRIVRCTLFYQAPCSSEVGGTAFEGENVVTELGFRARVVDSFTEGCITNTAVGVMGDLSNTASTTVSVGGAQCNNGGEFCNPPPADTTTLVSKLNASLIFPTNSTQYPPRNGGWTRNQYELLWGLACRATQSPTFMAAAAGSDGFEIQRVSCLPTSSSYPVCPSAPQHNAYYKGKVSYSVIPGTRLLLITDKIIGQTDGLFIHLVGHEMGHAAQAAGGNFGSNPLYIRYANQIHNCTKAISNYASSYAECADRAAEDHAEAIGFYLTGGEKFSRYWGYDQEPNGGDFRQEATATPGWLQDYYNHLKNDFFDGVEFDNNLP